MIKNFIVMGVEDDCIYFSTLELDISDLTI